MDYFLTGVSIVVSEVVGHNYKANGVLQRSVTSPMILTYLSAAFLRGVLAINTFDSRSRYRVEASRCLIITRTVIAFPIIINLMLCDLVSTPIRDVPIGGVGGRDPNVYET